MKKFWSFLLCMLLAFTCVGGLFENSPLDMAITSEAASEITYPYYYSKLSDKEKEHYKLLRNALIKHKENIDINDKISETELKKLCELLKYYDNVGFQLADASAVMYTNRAEVSLEYRYSKETYDKIISKLDEKSEEIISKFTEKTTTYSKIRIIHDSIIKKCTYDLDKKTNDTAYGVLVNGKAKCDGYSYAFAYVCSKAGIRTINVLGDSTSDGKTEGHMWNKVYYNKKWYNVDVTWDDPVSNMKNNATYDYFMVSDKIFDRSHAPYECPFKIPAATDDTKNYYVINKLTADSTASAKTLLISKIASSATKDKTKVTIQFTTKKAYEAFCQKVDENYGEYMFDILAAAQKKTKKKIITQSYLVSPSDDTYSVDVYIFYPKTKASKYYTDPSSLDSATIDSLKQMGISC